MTTLVDGNARLSAMERVLLEIERELGTLTGFAKARGDSSLQRLETIEGEVEVIKKNHYLIKGGLAVIIFIITTFEVFTYVIPHFSDK